MRAPSLLFSITSLSLLSAFTIAAQEDCTDCHDALPEVSAHLELGCTDCHEGVEEYPHETGTLAPSCDLCHSDVVEHLGEGVHAGFFEEDCASCHGAAHAAEAAVRFRLGVDETCGECHDDALSAVRASVHQDVERGMAPVCSDCHGAHTILATGDPDSSVYHLNVALTCSRCHGNEGLRLAADLPAVTEKYHDSIHGWSLEKSGLLVAPSCVTCHGAHDILSKEMPESRVSRANIAESCGSCHAGIFRRYQDSIHAERLREQGDAPVCIDCHSAHAITPARTEEWILGVAQQCGSCHEDLYRSYRRDFHGQVTAIGFAPAAKCSDCHGAHDITAVADAGSPVSEGRLLETCRQCHPKASASYASYDPHPDPNDRSSAPVYWSTRFMKALLTVVFIFFGIHTLLWLPRSFVERRRRQGLGGATGGEGGAP